jgi:tripartite-type tricarboxylate transporter receptor subunit TctC
VATLRLALAVATGTPTKSVREYLAWAKASPGKASFGSAGAGTPPHFLGVMVGRSAGVDLTHIAYKGGPPMVTDLAGGHIPAGVGTISDFGELHRAGKVRILALGGTVRLAGLTDVPTFKEQGYDIEGMTWLGMHAPAGTPRMTIDGLASAVATATRKPDIQERFSRLGFDLTGTSPEQFRRIMENDRAKWEPVIRASAFKEE